MENRQEKPIRLNLLNVMIVDDSLLAARKLDALFNDLGHRVIANAHTGEEAISAYRVHNPDLVTMDITMPGMTGIEATKLILKDFPDAIIIMVTSHGQEGMVREALKAGAKGYVLKPVKPEKLTEAIKRAFSQRSMKT